MKENNDFFEILLPVARDNNFEVKDIKPLAGGDINQVLLVTTKKDAKIVVKLSNTPQYKDFFEAEKEGLQALYNANCIDVPKVEGIGETTGRAYLLLEYITQGKPGPKFYESFGNRLALLHQTSAPTFGFKSHNYIGSLPQYNESCDTAAQFFITQRLKPQITLAEENMYYLGISEDFYDNITDSIPDEPPALIHGDLWTGNYLVNSTGMPCLIDPAVAYAPREMDLAMLKLFGNVPHDMLQSYNEIFPLERGFEDRVSLWQLYYLLVHLNIFGGGYKSRVTSIIKKYN